MRRLLLVPALALVLLGTPVLALEAPEPPPTTTTTIPLEPAGSDTPATTPATAAPAPAEVPATEATPGAESGETAIDATLVGVTWDGDPSASFTIEVKSSDGTWSEATEVEAAGEVDSGSRDAARSEAFPDNGTEPLWVGDDATAVRVTLEEGEATNVAVAAVDSEPAPAPDGAAGAIAGTLGTVDGLGRWVFGAALVAVVALLVALALGWRPRRGVRTMRWLAPAVGALLLAACVPVAQPAPQPGAVPNGPYPPQPAMYGRAAWGARPFACAGGPEYAPALKFAVVHHTVNSNSYGPGDSAAIMRGIQNYHLDALGYCDIAYQFLVDRFGTIWIGRAGGATKPVIGGHAGGFNTGSVGVALIGDFTAAQPPGGQWNSLVNLLRWRLSRARINPSQGVWVKAGSSPCGCVKFAPGSAVWLGSAIVPHRDLDYTACPGNAFTPRMNELRNAVQPGIRFPA